MPLRILCFGNSLTAGYYHYGLDYHSYSIQLKDRLDKVFPPPATETGAHHPDDGISIDVDGLSGDLVITPPGEFKDRMEQRFAKTQYDWVIVLGGTNDLGYSVFPVPKIFDALKASWAIPLSHGAKVLAMTIPECGVVSEPLNKNRDELNALILAHTAKDYYSFDLKAHVPYHSLDEETREARWDDGLHMTNIGYDVMGNVIADRLIELLRKAYQS